jgi:hypothetical protein
MQKDFVGINLVNYFIACNYFYFFELKFYIPNR